MELVLKKVKKKHYPVLKSLAKSLGFEIEEKGEKPYNSAFVKEILEGGRDIREGRGIKMTMKEIYALCK